MKKIFIILSIFTLLIACSNNNEGVKIFYGEKFEVVQPISTDDLITTIDAQGKTDAIQVAGTIEKSCTHTGCWMTLDNTAKQKIFVTYKDDAFTTAKKIEGKKVTLLGEGSFDQEKNQYEFVASGLILN